MEGDNAPENLLLCLGNPLLDISAVVDKGFLEKYQLKANDAILADEKHKNLYEELTEKFQVSYIAGGSAQNTARVAQWLIGKPKVTTYFGCVGNDKYSKILYDVATSSGVNIRYQYHETEPTGTCGVVITGHNRSLCANLGASGKFSADFLKDPENRRLLDTAQVYYTTGYFITANYEAQKEVAQVAFERNRPFILNLSAPFICQIFSKIILETLPYVDVLFGNESEAECLAESMNLGTKDLKEIALKLSQYPKENTNRQRVVVLTQGVDPTIVVSEGKIQTFPIVKLAQEKIVDTNGAGDAFSGGFISQFILGKSVETCVKCGAWAAAEIIQRSGCSFEGEPKFNPA